MRAALAVFGVAVGVTLAGSAWADKGGHGHHAFIVTDQDRAAVYTFYRTDYVAGRCPPGLMKRDNGCLPPGQARQLWTLGAPLPAAVVFSPLPAPLVAQLTPAPEGYQYVRIDNDVVLMALGTRVVTESLGSLSALQDPHRPLIGDPERAAVANYYRDDYLSGHCPDGLIRSEAGCRVPPIWALNEPLDPSVKFALLPDPLLAQLGAPPAGAQYIRLGDHVLLMMTDTRVIRADILDLTRLDGPGRVIVSAPAVAVAPATTTVVVPERVEYLGGGCPPGLAKKHNGCLPPGHAK